MGCAPKAAPAKDVSVEFMSGLPSFVGAESVVIKPIFKIKNPNDYMVSVDISYTLFFADETLGCSQLPKLYVPANSEVVVNDSIVISFMGWFSSDLLAATVPMPQVLGKILPIWKGLGGKQPALAKNEQWEATSPSKVVLTADMAIHQRSQAGAGKDIFLKLQRGE